MKIRPLLALALAAWVGGAHAQYPPPGGGGAPTAIYTALWWNPAESGWGLNTTHQGNIIFATLFTYAPDGEPLWLVAPNLVGMGSGYGEYGMESDYSYFGPLYRTHGPPFNAVPWVPIGFAQVGSMTITWTSEVTALLSYSMNGVTVMKGIRRQEFGVPVPECVAVSGSRIAETNYQDLWWNPDESGWGINLVQQGSTMFATLFTYSEAGRDKWFVAPALARQPDGAFTGSLYSTTGPAFNASPWVPIGFAVVGAMTLRFGDGENGTLTYTVGAAAVSKSIRRQVFAAVTSACR